ncbi:Apulose-4-phosphate transketolase subunit A [Alphaproteobacteria bacterium SO-S41]|nr:Apulose-4-phosphate transketolase subunit A [Alphaproteobacteria bacterium SO-S41]
MTALRRASTTPPVPDPVPRIAAAAARTRQLAVAGIYRAGSGHPGGSLSCADLLAALYTTELNIPGGAATDPTRDRFVLSKGHAAPALYAAWAAAGYVSDEIPLALRRINTKAQGHPHVLDMPLSETSTGSLGQGFSAAIGMALGLRHQYIDARVYTLLGDGECQEGEIWEGAMCAAHHGLSNLCAIVDYNKLQSDDRNANIMGLEPFAAKWRAFGWNALEIDGHDIKAILAALTTAAETPDQPTMIIAHTLKGKGVSYMEDQALWHGSVKMKPDETRHALTELGASQSDIDLWMTP